MATKKKTDLYVNAAGEYIRTMPDGREHISRDLEHDRTRQRHLAATPGRKELHAKLVEVKLTRVRRKKARQARKGWPADKSAV